MGDDVGSELKVLGKKVGNEGGRAYVGGGGGAHGATEELNAGGGYRNRTGGAVASGSVSVGRIEKDSLL